MSAPASPATLQVATESETAEGGRVRTWSDLAAVWVVLSHGQDRSEAAQEMRPERLESAKAVARDDPRAASGQRLALAGDAAPWRVIAVRRGEPAPGRMTLALERPA